ncbi:MAG: dTDP-4-dehydrorhamnose reductase [Gammaproteobacteria bacterium]|nr:dTDP-4-dehydrorhamnose reductase [Gammaproteobacteria bacterium]MBU1507020.1 dTDP-4-dehydrorhamnose reductase [Gammaproteobacteria bacterium]MBU2121778.1 dTDP-4-dehydrorhamnose reductase [Gammaproteobacteria bacterium]MBU2172797.1 dTDP-4-dehydrorhamnose reductase [Gammaproteobacteria bacterium]MBU2200699.1 dTDP-4-dehydrorhamnose reductase [Gammaproteobacteria bacterium]
MNILLFGKNGQVGWELQRSLSVLGTVTALDFDSADHCGDFANPAGVADTVRALRPDVIVNAAAHTAVDKAESEPEFARTLNATAPGAIAQEAARLGAWLVHYSTDYVFDGSGERPWVETDTPAPLNVYGRTKLEGEQLIQQSGARHLILRTSWVYAARGGNFAKTMLRLAQERERLTVIDDQWGAPTGADLLADVTAHALRHLQRQPQDAGLYHCVAAGETNWHLYAKEVLALAVQAQPAIKLKANEVAPVPTSSFPTPAARPHNSRLDTTHLQNTFGLRLPYWQAGVARMLAESL